MYYCSYAETFCISFISLQLFVSREFLFIFFFLRLPFFVACTTHYDSNSKDNNVTIAARKRNVTKDIRNVYVSGRMPPKYMYEHVNGRTKFERNRERERGKKSLVLCVCGGRDDDS